MRLVFHLFILIRRESGLFKNRNQVLFLIGLAGVLVLWVSMACFSSSSIIRCLSMSSNFILSAILRIIESSVMPVILNFAPV